jgi:hypothetical protein
MERTVPSTESEEIELYQRTYYSLLRTTDEVQIRSLVESHARMQASLHVKAGTSEIDLDALVYSTLRLPPQVRQVRLVVMSPSETALQEGGYPDVASWQIAASPVRRRRMRFDGRETLAAYIASSSDIDDLIPLLTAYQIEWNKVHQRLHGSRLADQLADRVEACLPTDASLREAIGEQLGLAHDEVQRLDSAYQGQLCATLVEMAQGEKRFAVRLLASSYVDYRRAARYWWEHIVENTPVQLSDRPVYFVSSNTHSLVNLLTGRALRREQELVRFIKEKGDERLREEYRAIQQETVRSNWQNFLYYAFKKYTQTEKGQAAALACDEEMCATGIWHVPSLHYLDVGAQVIVLRDLEPAWFDPRLTVDGLERLRESNAVILNIDYPLGVGAYRVLTQVTSGIGRLEGLYILGKAATLNGRVGDVMVPSVVHDEHSQNTYLFRNAFASASVRPHLVYGTVLDNQKAISVRGTFLQNRDYMDVFYREGFTDIEMEAGPYLSAVYEAIRPERYPFNEIVNLYNAPFEIGILHYASDTPFTKGKTLAEHLSYYGVDPTYACSVAILRQILEREVAAIGRNGDSLPNPREAGALPTHPAAPIIGQEPA